MPARAPQIQAEVKHPSALSDADIAQWRAFCAAEPAFRNPLLGPDFARLVGEVRTDARVAVLRRRGSTVGFLPFHKRGSGYARPIGAAFSDYHALVSAPGERPDLAEAMRAAGVGALRFTGLVDPAGACPLARPSPMQGHLIALAGSPEARHDALRAANPKRYKNWRRLENKLEREFGAVSVSPGDRDPAAFAQLLDWKREQFRRTGAHDVLRPAWAQALFAAAFAARSSELCGVMTTLRAGGRLVAGHFGVASAGVCHVWISAMDPDCVAGGPGQVLMLHAPELMQALGLRVYDLGPGHAHYKAPFATGQVSLGEGVALAAGSANLAARSMEGAWALAGGRIDAVGRLRRRLDQIDAAELSISGRVLGLIEAVAGQGRRASSREQPRADATAEQA